MPRRHANARPERRRTRPVITELRPLTYDELAERLVKLRLASPAILGPMRHPFADRFAA